MIYYLSTLVFKNVDYRILLFLFFFFSFAKFCSVYFFSRSPWTMGYGLMVPFKCVACFKTPLFITNGLTLKIAWLWKKEGATETSCHVSCGISKTNVSQRGNLVHVLPEFFSIEIVSFQYRFDWWLATRVPEIAAVYCSSLKKSM